MAWAVENRRHAGVNSGVRSIESMLARNLWVHDRFSRPRVNWEALEAITVADYDTVECMVAWWAGHEAAAMRKIARPLIQAANEKLLAGMFHRDAP